MKTSARWIFFLVICALWTSNCFGKLGESVAEIEARYGKPVYEDTFEGNRALHYKFGEFQITVIFKAGKSASESLLPIADERKLGDDECRALIEAISGTKQWKGPYRTKVFVSEWASAETFLASRTEDTLKTEMLVVATTELNRTPSEKRSKQLVDMASSFGDAVSRTPPPMRIGSIDSSGASQGQNSALSKNDMKTKSVKDALFNFRQDHRNDGDPGIAPRSNQKPFGTQETVSESLPKKSLVSTAPQ